MINSKKVNCIIQMRRMVLSKFSINMHKFQNIKLIYIIELVSIFFVIFSFFFSKYLQFFPVIIGLSYIIFYPKSDYCVAVLIFFLPFSSILNFGGSSLFSILELGIIIRFIFYKGKFDFKNVILILIFLTYGVISLFLSNSPLFGLKRLINLLLWYFTIYVMIYFTQNDSYVIIGKNYIFAMILSCLVGLFSNKIPGMTLLLTDTTISNSQIVTSVNRFSGLWNDPNTYSIFINIGLLIAFLLYSVKSISFFKLMAYSIILTFFALLSFSKMSLLLSVFIWTYMILFNGKISFKQRLYVGLIFISLFIIIFSYFNDIFSVYLSRFIVRDGGTGVIDSLTTHRSTIWMMYIRSLNDSIFYWVFGNGIGSDLLNQRASHQTIIQIIYNIGIVGFVIYFVVYYSLIMKLQIIVQGKVNLAKKKSNKISIIIISIPFIGCLFLDYFFIENIYFLIYICFLFYYSVNLIGNDNKDFI